MSAVTRCSGDLQGAALARCQGLLVTTNRCTAPAHEPGGVFRGTALRAGVQGDRRLVRDDGRIGQRPAEGVPFYLAAAMPALTHIGLKYGGCA